MQPVNSDKTHWQSVNRLPSEQYEITIEDNVGNWANISGANRDRYLTHAPNIDTLQPMILASAGHLQQLERLLQRRSILSRHAHQSIGYHNIVFGSQ